MIEVAAPPLMIGAAPPRPLTRRQRAALPGSRHDRLIMWLNWLLPAAALVMALAMLIWPLAGGQEFSFLLAKDQVAVARERLRVARAEYRGRTTQGDDFSISADSAVQRSSAVPIVELTGLVARLDGRDGPSTASAPSGRYFIETDQLEVAGPVLLRADGGYRLDAETVIIDLKRRTVTTDSPVSGRLPIGEFRANAMSGDLAGRRTRLEGDVHLRINGGGGKG